MTGVTGSTKLSFVGFCFALAVVNGQTWQPRGLFPVSMNVAPTAAISVNATCGETSQERFCQLVDHSQLREPQCGICDAFNFDLTKRHPITFSTDGSEKWWQSPSLQNGQQYEWVTITLDLKQVYQVAYIIIKAANSPRPGNWILERSVDGRTYKPWQYYAVSDIECRQRYGIEPKAGRPRYRLDDEVICTSYYSKVNPVNNGEIHTSLVGGRPGATVKSRTIQEFTRARYVRLRLQKIITLSGDLMAIRESIDRSVSRRYFYSIKDITINGACECYGHANKCSMNKRTGVYRCECQHNTCGINCDKCCPMYNQKKWRSGTVKDGAMCEKCKCHGHAQSCKYNEEVARRKLSMNTIGEYGGGGVCENCQDDTMGNNCELCKDGFYRPIGVAQESKRPCRRCSCQNLPGSTGECIKDDSRMFNGLEPGNCICKKNFAGPKCDRCAEGYKDYPNCTPCPCDHAGTKNWSCGLGTCTCKENVVGRRCDQCKQGSYYLEARNPEGCTKCYCFGVTNRCNSSELSAVTVKQTRGWTVTDLTGKKKVISTLEDSTSRIADDDMAGYNMYYWQAPKDYLGEKIQSYGGQLKFVIGYAKDRGDTAGVHIDDINVIMEGRNMKIGYGGGTFRADAENTFVVPLWKHDWYKLDDNGKKIRPITKEEMMNVLQDVDRLLIRGKFHTDQIEGILNEVAVDVGSAYAVSNKKMNLVERCECPPGYTGLSCQHCMDGYRRVNRTQCVKCNCNNHAERCDPGTGACINCLHNTYGPRCENCDFGFYGDATRGQPDDCKPCACPLEDPNNFSKTCTAVKSATGDVIDFKCSECEHGYVGDKCQRCDDRFFGNPLAPGNFCQPCDCNNNTDPSDVGVCNTNTGECLKCIYNTDGWRCEICKEGFYGNALRQDCRACDCSSYGAVSPKCNERTGKCTCLPNFVGDKCDRCAAGYGSVSEGCRPCNCHTVGSRSRNCNPQSGICECKPGVFGTKCDSCLDGYYGFSIEGCSWCGCDPDGSNATSDCNALTGQCSCKELVVGRACDRCTTGYWGLRSENGCKKCDCNTTGSISQQCDDSSGRCQCKPGVGGDKCDRCLPGYFGWSFRGCRKCARCDQPGHLCDPKTGECVCPPNTRGDRCQFCKPRTYGYDKLRGCKECDCDPRGSMDERCDPRTGECRCLEGVEGEKCDKCRYGYYNFPRCRPCNCDSAGTLLSECRSERLCQCDDNGQCPCKIHTMTRDCSRCKPLTFSLTKTYEGGCYGCFCYGKSLSCQQGYFSWSEITLPAGRRADMDQTRSRTIFNITNGLKTIPEQTGNIRMGISALLDGPLYWSLPKTFLGDRSLSYNGLLRFKVSSYGRRRFLENSLKRFPLVQIQGNWRLILEFYADVKPDGNYQVRLREDFWKVKGNPHTPVTRPMMMVALQNVQHFLIRATTFTDPQQAFIENVSLQFGVASSTRQSSSQAVGLETCQCPRQYIGASCQDPAEGHYRKRKDDFLNSKDILDLVGISVPCDCNGRSQSCDRETGICFNCRDNTTGSHCELCSVGFYGNPALRPCRPCACPLVSNSFSNTCIQDGSDYYCTNCEPGYTGRYCHKCANGYYGDPGLPGGKCTPCACAKQGSTSAVCDPRTGQCSCKEGITGRDCSICKPRYVITANGCESCDDDCAGLLLRDVDYFMGILNNTHISGLVPAPWQALLQYENRTRIFRSYLQEYERALKLGQQLVKNFNFDFDLESLANLLLLNAKETAERAPAVTSSADQVYQDSLRALKEMETLIRYILDVINKLNQYGLESLGPAFSISRALEEAERILLEIKTRNFDPNKDGAERELRKARNLLERIKGMMFDRNKLDVLKERLSKLRELIQDLVFQLSNKVKKPTEEALRVMRTSQNTIDRTEAAYNEAQNLTELTKQILENGEDLIIEADRLLREAKRNFQVLPGLLKTLVTQTRNVRKKVSLLARLNPIYRRRHVIPAQQHAANLMRQAAMLSKLFKATRDISEYPLRAAKVYRNIVDALIDAMAAAQNASFAADNAHAKAFPDFGDSLVDRASRLKAKSRQLLEAAKKLRDNEIPNLQYMLSEQTGILDMTERAIQGGKRELAYINRALDNLPVGTRQSLLNAIDDATLAGDYASDAANRTDNLMGRIRSELILKLRLIQSGSAAGLGNISLVIDQAREDIKAGVKEAENLIKYKKKLHNIGNQIHLDLDGLRRKILQARQTASTIRVSLSNDKSGKCLRSYLPEIGPTTTNKIVATYGVNTTDTDALLFYLGSPLKEDFMALEMVNRKIRFSWNTGGKLTGSLQHNLTLDTNDKTFSANSKWYKIEVNRFGNLATLSVQPSPEGAIKDPNMVSGASSTSHSLMDLDSNSNFFIGGVPNNIRLPPEVRTKVYAGCLFQLKIDERQVGLWNFKTSQGCEGCKEGPSEEVDYSILNFKGKGYLSMPQIPDYQIKSFSIALHFKTYDENALLFFSPNEKTGEYISVELRDGKLVYQFKIGTHTSLLLTTRKKYNNGAWTKVIAERLGLQGLLSVQNELLEGSLRAGGRATLDLRNSRLFFGGVPPTFNEKNETWKSVSFGSILGCMKGLQMDTTPLGIFRSQSYDVEAGCKQQAMRSVGFKGKGYIEMKSAPLSDDSSFSFTFSTAQPDSLLLLSTFVGKQSDRSQIQNYYSVSLVNGKLEARFDAGSGPKILKVDSVLNDNAYHLLAFIKTGRRIEMRLDDQPMGSIQLGATTTTISAPSNGGLYFGGVPPGLIVDNMAASDIFFTGTIKDAIFDRKLLKFHEAVTSRNVAIGRTEGADLTRPVPGTAVPGSSVEKCADSMMYSWEPRAISFGDSLDSHIVKSIDKKAISSVFDLKVDFRTFYSNGMLMMLRNLRRQAYLIIHMKDGKLYVDFKGKATRQLSSQGDLNDGQWHSVHLVKKTKKLELTVDSGAMARARVGKKLYMQPTLYVGKIPNEFDEARTIRSENFKGCLRNLKLNDRFVDLVSGKVKNVGQCFSNIESGSYFGGDAYATYANNFNVGTQLEVALEFKTTSLNGILMSVSDILGSPAFAVELNNGNVSVSVDMGYTIKTFSATQTFDSKYFICDGKWHSVKAVYSRNAVTLRVDNLTEQFGFSEFTASGVTTRNPLYIGGLPDGAAKGALQVKDNFVGCLRNIAINKKQIDWKDMAGQTNVLPNSCPAA